MVNAFIVYMSQASKSKYCIVIMLYCVIAKNTNAMGEFECVFFSYCSDSSEGGRLVAAITMQLIRSLAND